MRNIHISSAFLVCFTHWIQNAMIYARSMVQKGTLNPCVSFWIVSLNCTYGLSTRKYGQVPITTVFTYFNPYAKNNGIQRLKYFKACLSTKHYESFLKDDKQMQGREGNILQLYPMFALSYVTTCFKTQKTSYRCWSQFVIVLGIWRRLKLTWQTPIYNLLSCIHITID